MAPDDQVDIAVLKIYEHYFGASAADQVNLPVNIVRSITLNIDKRNLHRALFDAAQVNITSITCFCWFQFLVSFLQRRILALMEGSQWHRYPSSTFFEQWVEAKLSNPDSLFPFNTPRSERRGEDGKKPCYVIDHLRPPLVAHRFSRHPGHFRHFVSYHSTKTERSTKGRFPIIQSIRSKFYSES